ncbi:cation-independent mannose-6-phosphate receptor isoform X2 [Bufo gargarizans]|uniref:cation-independent mannose-6-phosphate receptor isoform X2 n=1 Tax=Bufo gargarizans TaxID=30331 RepID=UPI001CF559D9|nr:cation-independent mannose-6-phosphate receptor isoform X2 [Bufo gargarizans]
MTLPWAACVCALGLRTGFGRSMKPPGISALVAVLLVVTGVTGQTTGVPSELCGHTWEALDDEKNVHYKINLCESLHANDCAGTECTISAHDMKENTSKSVGTLPAQFSDNVLVFNTTESCPGSEHKIQSVINLLCGKSLGTPEFIKYDECVHYFEWRTFPACKKNKFKPIKEVPCYVFDSDYKKHDLNPLIKTSGGHSVNSWDHGSDLYINICRTIGTSVGNTSSCPPKSAACLIKDGKAYDVGQPKSALASYEKDRLVLQYETDNKPDFCNGHSPTVKITFSCPSSGTEVTDPKLTASSNCRYEVEWVTENACHVDYLESDNCTLISKERGISIDLSPLREKPANPYHAQDPKGEYTYYLNVCDKISEGGCLGDSVSSCQKIMSNTISKSAGSYKNQTLRFSDGDITLTYPGGEICGSGFQRMTVINFICNETAVNDGKGLPEFQSEADCTYFFSWQTKYACLKKKEDMCYVESKKKQYNLFNLMRTAESSDAQNWEAVNLKPSDKSHFYINVCHDILQTREASVCEDDAAVCAVGPGVKKNLGKFQTQPKLVNGHVVLEYTDGSPCAENKQIHTKIILMCSPGNRESPPVLKSAEECYYEFEWNTAAACIVSRTEGDDCTVSDPQAGFYFDLSPLTSKSENYNITTDTYNFYINVCSNVTQQPCEPNSGACQVAKEGSDKWNLGVGNSKLSYYDGMIQLGYTGGSPYNDEKKTPRSSLITFLCDRSVDIGQPEYQKEDNYTYNFKWYTKYACPALPVECVVVDEATDEQYDLSSLSKVQGEHSSNWFAMDQAQESHKKYYINVCRSLVPVKGCDPFAAVCQMGYTKVSSKLHETVAVNNMGVASKKPIIEGSGKILIKYTNGSECINEENNKVSYSSQLHLICEKGAVRTSPRFMSNENCVATFLWNTEAACPIIKSIHGNEDCLIENPNTGFTYNFESLKNESGYEVEGNGKTYKLNICGPVSDCGQIGNSPAAGCEIENHSVSRPVKLRKSLDLASEGTITLTYSGAKDDQGPGDSFTINFECNDDLYPGRLSFKREEINSETHLYHTFFNFETAMACSPAPVDCQVTDSNGNEYDLSDLSRDDEPWIAVDPSDQATKRKFYLNICKPLPYTRGCSGGAVGSCMQTSDHKNLNLGYIQMSPQASDDGSLTIVYMSGDKCSDKKHYSTRVIFQCDHNVGSPVFQEQDDCEYVFLWRTSEACPVSRAEGDNCQVKDPKYDYVYNLQPLGEKVIELADGEYNYQLKVCGGLKDSACSASAPAGSSVSSCQVKGSNAILAGLTNQKLIYEDGIIKINYTGGALCHKKYHRSTLIIFQCDKTEEKPVFLKETPDCIYKFEWRTPLACLPFKPIDCSFKDTLGRSYDLSQLSLYNKNWEVDSPTDPNMKFRINVCRPLVPETGPASCPHGSAVCLLKDNKAVNLGELVSSPRWDNGVSVLEYKNGDRCLDGIRNGTTTIRFMCDLNKVVSGPELITKLQDCDYNFLWVTAYACPLTISTHDKCKVRNSATGYQFDLSSLSSKDGYLIKDRDRSIRLNICSDVNSPCGSGVGVCVSEGVKNTNAGKSHSRITYVDQMLKLVYEEGDQCEKNPLMKHRSVFTFVCGADRAGGSLPSLISYTEDTCTWQFSWQTPLVCEEKIECSVKNGTSLIDLSPLIKRGDYYEVLQSQDRDDSNFYINICQPLNNIEDLKCPLGASACRVTSGGKPIDIGRQSGPPQIDQTTQTVSIRMESWTPCESAEMGQGNYSTTIIFHCNAGTDLGRPKFLQLSECNYLFEWDTPLVCPDVESVSGCALTDQKLQYTFNFSSLSKETYKVSEQTNTYHIGVCSPAQSMPSGNCNGAVCLQSGNTAISFGNINAMKMEYHHQQDMVELTYVGGDLCSPSTENRQSTILFKCDESAGKGFPVLISEPKGCSAMFEWKTQLACLPKQTCKMIFNHQTYDLRSLSSMTGNWDFTQNGDRYYLNLCQRVNQGPSGCSETASVCQESNGKVQVLGRVHSQEVTLQDKTISVTYSNGDLCEKEQRFSTTINLICKNITGKPVFQKHDAQSCHYYIQWETRAACAVVPKEVTMTNGIIHLENGVNINLTRIYIKSYTASGDIRTKDKYIYEIQLSGNENSTYPKCNKASICQVKTTEDFTRAVGSAGNAKYYLDDDDLDVVFTSSSKCGKDKTKNATSSILLRCSPSHGEGQPEFLHETADCQYLFAWHTSAVCPLVSEEISDKSDNENQYQGLSGRSQAVGAVLSILLVILVACLVVLLLYKKERREMVMYKLTNCCRRSSSVSYKYTKINTEEEADNETEWLMEEVSANHGKPHHENGHIRSVKAGAFTSLHVDDLDSEDEVLTVPEVRIQSARNKQKISHQPLGQYVSGSDENLIGVANGEKGQTGKSRSHKKEDKPTIASFHDDSDEDLLHV